MLIKRKRELGEGKVPGIAMAAERAPVASRRVRVSENCILILMFA